MTSMDNRSIEYRVVYALKESGISIVNRVPLSGGCSQIGKGDILFQIENTEFMGECKKRESTRYLRIRKEWVDTLEKNSKLSGAIPVLFYSAYRSPIGVVIPISKYKEWKFDRKVPIQFYVYGKKGIRIDVDEIESVVGLIYDEDNPSLEASHVSLPFEKFIIALKEYYAQINKELASCGNP